MGILIVGFILGVLFGIVLTLMVSLLLAQKIKDDDHEKND